MTYFATDIAYHVHKFKNHDILINIWGADHHDYAVRLTNAMKALGYDVENRLQIHLVQFANLIMSGKSISMSTRSGDFYPIQDLVNEIGPDATKYFYLTKKKEQHLEFDVDLAIKKIKIIRFTTYNMLMRGLQKLLMIWIMLLLKKTILIT
jgi:arginyl-tRNA synthetase